MTLQLANYNQPEAHYFWSISVLITRPSTNALNHTFSSSATFISASSSALNQACSSSASASLGHQPYLLLLRCLHIGVFFSTQSSLFLLGPQPRLLFHTQMAAFISASSSALNQACSFLVLNHASSSIIRGAMSNQLGMSKRQKPFSCQRKLNGPIKPKEIIDTVWLDGYDSNPLYGQDPNYCVNSGIAPTQNSVYVSFPKCHWHISSSSITRYSNPISHITSCCGGVTYLHSLVCAAHEDAGLEDGKEARQQNLHEAL
jgi:hypothetical protein